MFCFLTYSAADRCLLFSVGGRLNGDSKYDRSQVAGETSTKYIIQYFLSQVSVASKLRCTEPLREEFYSRKTRPSVEGDFQFHVTAYIGSKEGEAS